ncbi:YwqI/YxiC family protein [Shouchella clausii]|jgi:hypothetical protein|uniref:YwqI/YxiC family protein n=1 Tax=Shouchella rhizosphaerae TaxID=866786 RepID=A0ABZ2CMT8_9BACI|nr:MULTISPECIES: YwqI/YxiC family protein [Shouchella]MCM3314524.1 YwqI/YxiC family protein [Psychrobacillus sp. MER TA 17]MBX0317338.1 YwqI/YxiC family protein [Shouchella clausii]PAE81918.1 hypothetical protein CHH77_12720 [Shouchella clausii]SHL88305.1 hypothetical protein SAMN05192535_3812 [Shouchella rhizosphaerae]GIN09030.1 hypothetical protein J1TS1_31750 [Shouchella clausii]
MAEIKVNEAEALEVFENVANAANGFTPTNANIEMATSLLEFLEKVNQIEDGYKAQIQAYMEALNKMEQESQRLIKVYGETDRALANQG